MQRFTTRLFLVPMLFAVLGCSGDEATETETPSMGEWRDGRFHVTGYSIAWPEEWKERNAEFLIPMTMDDAQAAKGGEKPFLEKARVELTPIGGDETLEEFLTIVSDTSRAGLDDYRAFNPETLQIDGQEARVMRAEFTDPVHARDLNIMHIIYVVRGDGNVASITFTFLASNYTQYREQFDEIAQSFRFE